MAPVSVVLVAAGWTVAVVGALAGAFALPPQLALLALACPPVLGLLALRRPEPSPALAWSAGWTALVTGALVAGAAVHVLGPTVLVVPGALIAAVACARFPAAATVGAFAVTGLYGSIEAFTPLPAGPLADALLVGLWLGLLWSHLIRGRRPAARIWPGVIAPLAFVAVTACQMASAETLANGLHAFRGTAWYMLAFLLVGYAVRRPATRERIAKGVLLVAAGVGLYATYRLAVGHPASREYFQSAAADPTNFLDGELRLVGSFLSAKALALWCAVTIPFCLAVGLSRRGRWRIVAAVACAACTAGLFGTEVRTGGIALAGGLLVVFLLYQLARAYPGLHLGVTVTALIGAALVAVTIFSFTGGGSESSRDRYLMVLQPTHDAAFQARLLRWRTVLGDIDRHPLGQGLGSAGRVQRQRGRFANISSYDIDNSYLQIAYEQGLGAMLLFAAGALALLVSLARRAALTRDRGRAGVAIGACGALAAYLLMLPTGSYIEGLGTLAAWMLVGLGVGQFAYDDETPASAYP
jgi:hypothetical protein